MQTVRYVFNQNTVCPNHKVIVFVAENVFFTVFNHSVLTKKTVSTVFLSP